MCSLYGDREEYVFWNMIYKNGVMEIQKEKTDEYFIFFNAKERCGIHK